MANVIRIKRRVTGIAGAPSALRSAELAHNEVDDTLYVGKGDDGSGNATSVIALAGRGAFVDLSNAQTVAGAKTFSTVPKASQDASGSTDLVRKSQLDALLTAKAPPGVSGAHRHADRTYCGGRHQHDPDRHHRLCAGSTHRCWLWRHADFRL